MSTYYIMKKIYKFFVIFFFLFFSNQSHSEKHNQLSVEIDRIKNDIIDLQKFVYKNESSLSNNTDSSKKNDLDFEDVILDEESALNPDFYKLNHDFEKTNLLIHDPGRESGLKHNGENSKKNSMDMRSVNSHVVHEGVVRNRAG